MFFELAGTVHLVRNLHNHSLHEVVQTIFQRIYCLVRPNHLLYVVFSNYGRIFSILFAFLTEFVSADGVAGCSALGRRLPSEHILNRQDFIKKLELLFGNAPLILIQVAAIEIFDMLEPVDDKGFEADAPHNFVVVDL